MPKFSATPPIRNEGSLRRILVRGDLVDPGKHAGGRGLAVGARDDQGFAPSEKLFVEQCGHGGKRDALIEYAFDLGIAARECVADHNEVRLGVEIDSAYGSSTGFRARAGGRSWADTRPCQSR